VFSAISAGLLRELGGKELTAESAEDTKRSLSNSLKTALIYCAFTWVAVLCSGSTTAKVVPLPTVLVTSIRP